MNIKTGNLQNTRYQRFLQIKNEYRTKSLFDINLRVALYGRVSTDRIEQKTSIINQETYYTNMIRNNPNWEYVGEYIDEGITGISTKKRENFNKMIDDAIEGKFDLIITKEISRFARNTLDSIYYTRTLLENNVAVYFQNDNINTLDDDSALRLTIMSGIAQEEITKLSKRIKFGHNQSIKNGTVFGNSLLYGYRKENGKLVIVPEEAKMIRYIFERYATNETSTKKLADELYKMGYRNSKGGKIDAGVIKNILRNPKYKGYYCGGKVEIVDIFSKKQYFKPETEWTVWKDENGDTVPAIVPEDLWNKSYGIYMQRGTQIKSRRSSYKTNNFFTGKIYCMKHNEPFWLKQHRIRDKDPNPYWICRHKIRNKRDSCNTVGVYESELFAMIFNIVKQLCLDIDQITETYVKMLKSTINNNDLDKQLIQYEQEIASLEKKKEKILEFNLNGHISDKEFIKRNDAYNKEILSIQEKIDAIEKISYDDLFSDIVELKKLIQSYADIKIEDLKSVKIINELFDKIYVKGFDENLTNDDIKMEFMFVLNSGQSIKHFFERNKRSIKNNSADMCCSGDTLKTIYPEQHIEFHICRVANQFVKRYTYTVTI